MNAEARPHAGYAEIEKSEPVSILLFTDPGRDSDDTAAFAVARRLQALFELGLPAAITTLDPTLRRAELARFITDNLGMTGTSIIAGKAGKNGYKTPEFPYEFNGIPKKYGRERISRARIQGISEVLNRSNDASVDTVVIAGFTDLDAYIQNPKRAELFVRKTKRITIMGGVRTGELGGLELDENGFLQPDTSANYQFDPEAAARVIAFAQQHDISLRFITRHAAYAAQLSRDAYDAVASSGNPVGTWLKQAVSYGFQHLWERANLPVDDPKRTLPARCDRTWFLTTFCKSESTDLPGNGDIWPHIQSITPYDPLTIISTVPELMNRFFTPSTFRIGNTIHEIIGPSAANHGVKNPEDLRAYLTECLTRAVKRLHGAIYVEQLPESELRNDLGSVTVPTGIASHKTTTFTIASYGWDAIPSNVWVHTGYSPDGDKLYSKKPVSVSVDGDLVFTSQSVVYD